ncbi:MAG: hypothetical protein HYR64_07855 [Fimbriimonas ginsengisoli]|uniref:Uncharacterized protein n=1 Tax=Fimbriimonas ginsengisoli TaxID=1005039 RepID=A0A931PU39_FIMGI|nr:hypothetical protein [Fimbriimonas ginsengisoli]
MSRNLLIWLLALGTLGVIVGCQPSDTSTSPEPTKKVADADKPPAAPDEPGAQVDKSLDEREGGNAVTRFEDEASRDRRAKARASLGLGNNSGK